MTLPLVVLCLVKIAVIAGADTKTRVYDDGTGIVKTDTSEYTDEAGVKHVKQTTTKNGRAGEIFTETVEHFVYNKPVGDLPLAKLSPFHAHFHNEDDSRRVNHGGAPPPPDGARRRRPDPQSDHHHREHERRNPPDHDDGRARPTEKDESQNRTSSSHSVASRSGALENATEVTGAETSEREPSPCDPARRDCARVTADGDLKVYIDGGNAGAKINDTRVQNDDGKIYFEPDLEKESGDSNIMKIDRSRPNVSTSTETEAEVVGLDNRNAFEVNVTCELPKILLEGKCKEPE